MSDEFDYPELMLLPMDLLINAKKAVELQFLEVPKEEKTRETYYKICYDLYNSLKRRGYGQRHQYNFNGATFTFTY